MCDSTPLLLHICHFRSISMLVPLGYHHVTIHSFIPAYLARGCLTVIVVTSLCVAQETVHLKKIARGGGAKVLADVPIPRDCLR